MGRKLFKKLRIACYDKMYDITLRRYLDNITTKKAYKYFRKMKFWAEKSIKLEGNNADSRMSS